MLSRLFSPLCFPVLDHIICNSQFICLFGVLRHFQHCTGHITSITGSWKGRGNQYIQFVRVLYCKLPTNSKQLPAFPLEAVPGNEPVVLRTQIKLIDILEYILLQYIRHFCQSVSYSTLNNLAIY